MKRAAAIILSLTVIWLQMVVSAQTNFIAAADDACGCCAPDIQHRCCCVAPADTAPTPVAAMPALGTIALDYHADLCKRVAWLLPATAPASVSSESTSALLPSAVPLFARNCALLI